MGECVVLPGYTGGYAHGCGDARRVIFTKDCEGVALISSPEAPESFTPPRAEPVYFKAGDVIKRAWLLRAHPCCGYIADVEGELHRTSITRLPPDCFRAELVDTSR
jgi:hypothetical protein